MPLRFQNRNAGFVACQAAVDRLPQQIGQRELFVQALPRVAEMLLDQLPDPEPFVQFANENQPTIGSHPRSQKTDPQKSVVGQLKCLFFALTHWVLISSAP